jgi:superfamily II helicase
MRLTPRPSSRQENPQEVAAAFSVRQSKKLGQWIPPIQWNQIEKRNLLCEICSTPITYCSAVDAICSLCNVVAHLSCLTEKQMNLKYRNCWICEFCAEDIEISKDIFHSYQNKQLFLVDPLLLHHSTITTAHR